MSDLLTKDDLYRCCASSSTFDEALQAAASIGAQHARELAARTADALGSSHNYDAEMIARHIAAMIRRGDGVPKMEPPNV